MDQKKDSSAGGLLAHAIRFFSDIFKSVAESFLVVMATYIVATMVSAGLLWFYEWPLFLAPVGGFIVLGVMLVLWYDS